MAEEMEMELEVVKVCQPVKDFSCIVRRSRKRREVRRRCGGKHVEVVTIQDESKKKCKPQAVDVPSTNSVLQLSIKVPQVDLREKDMTPGAPKSYVVSSKKIEGSEQVLKRDNGKDVIASIGSSGCGTTDEIILAFESDTTNDSSINTCNSGTTDDSGVMSDFTNDSVISANTSDSLSVSDANESVMTSSSSDNTGFVFDVDPVSPMSTTEQDANLNCSGDEDMDDSLVSPPPSPATPEDSNTGMPKLCRPEIYGDFEGDEDEADDVHMPVLFPESTEQSGDCEEAIGGVESQETWMGDEDEEEKTQSGKKKIRIRIGKKRFGLAKKKGRTLFFSLEETRSGCTRSHFWCKLCDTFHSTIDKLRGHIGKEHRMDGSLVNRFNVATWDLEIARTFENPLDLEMAQEA